MIAVVSLLIGAVPQTATSTLGASTSTLGASTSTLGAATSTAASVEIAPPVRARPAPARPAPARPAPAPVRRSSAEDFDWIFAKPGPYEWMLSGGVGFSVVGRASGERQISPIYRLSLRRSFIDTFTLGLGADFIHTSERGGMLEASNTRTFLSARAGAYVWASRFRFDAGVEAGAQLETASLTDGVGPSRSTFRTRPVIGFTGGAGIAIRGTAVFELIALVRREPEHTNVALALSLEFLF